MNKSVIEREKKLYHQFQQSILIDGKPLYAGRILQRASHLFGETTALVFHDININYRQLYARASGLCLKIKDHGIKPHDRVVLCFENSPEFYIAYYAIWQAGAVVVPL